jgi:predicted nucleic acid-binding protein
MIVSDSTTLIILFDLEQIDLLSNLFAKVYIPSTVYKEISVKKEITLPFFMEVVEVEHTADFISLNKLLDEGESEAILLAKKMELGLIIDEKKGRKIAVNYGVKIIGLLGILYLNIKKGYLTKNTAKMFLARALDHGYRINQKLISEMFKNL